jgi:hypothetical protein
MTARFLSGFAVSPETPRLRHVLPREVQQHERVRINPRYVARAVTRDFNGRPGFILEGSSGRPLGWVPAADWLEAEKRSRRPAA